MQYGLLLFFFFFWLIGFAFLFNWFVFYIQRQFLSMEGQCEIRDKAVKYIYVHIVRSKSLV